MPPITTIILAAGQGKRMGTTGTHKVCFPIHGRPAIVRALDTYKRAGLRRFIVVVGQMAENVMATVAEEHPDVTFVFQKEALGTGHATHLACRSLAESGYTGKVLITMGDKVVDPSVIRDLVARAESDTSQLTLVTLPFSGRADAGRVLLEGEGRTLGIVEKKDLLHLRESGEPIAVGGRLLDSAAIDSLEARNNASLYLYDFAALWSSLRQLRPNNQQGELYLTDTVGLLRSAGENVDYLDVEDKEKVMAFNTPAELLAVEEVFARREKAGRVRFLSKEGETLVENPEQGRRAEASRYLKPAGEWLRRLESPDAETLLQTIYGDHPDTIRIQHTQILGTLREFITVFGSERPIIICRAPGRINLMGRHVEHRGGDVNVMAISRESVVVAAPREDDVITLHNRKPEFPDREFRIRDLLEHTSWDDWLEFIDSATVRQVLQEAPGDWSHYARAPLLRLQHESVHARLRGMDCVVDSNIPMGAGLSSSSSLVVAFALAAIALNDMDVELADFIDLCGEGEWFVGSRGGNGDHAAIRVGEIGAICHLGFFPFQLKGQAPMPPELCLVVADSAIKAQKSAGAKDAFNHRIAAYVIGQMLLQQSWPAAAGATHLRDLSPERLQVHHSDLYRALMLLPEMPTRETLRPLFQGDALAKVERIFGSHADIGPYDLRGVVLYGLAECARSARFARLLAEGNPDAIGQAMAISHDGDRVARSDLQHPGVHSPFYFDTSDASLEALARSETDLALLPGAYACSTPEIDYLTDLATSVPGVIGAQLSGAGLGGCVMILTRREAVPALEATLTQGYYTPRNLPPRITPCLPVQGAAVFFL